MTRRYRQAVEQYLTLHAPRVLQRASDPRHVIAEYAQRVAELVKDDLDHAEWNMHERPTKELRTRVERVAFPLIMTQVAPPEREEMRGIGEAEANFVALSDTILKAPTPMALRAMEGRDQLLWETQQPVDLIGGGSATSWEQVVEDHARQRAALEVLRGMDAEGLARIDEYVPAALRGNGRQLNGVPSWHETARVITREIQAGTFATPAPVPTLDREDVQRADEVQFLTGTNEAESRWRLQAHLYDKENPGASMSERMPELLRTTTINTLSAEFVQGTIRSYQRDADPTTVAAVQALRSVQPEHVEHLQRIVAFGHTDTGTDRRLSQHDLLAVIKTEVDRGTFDAPDSAPSEPVFGANYVGIQGLDLEEYREQAAVDFARDTFRYAAHQAERIPNSSPRLAQLRENPIRPTDIHSQASSGPVAVARLDGPSFAGGLS